MPSAFLSDDVHEQVRVGLPARAQPPVALRVRHGAVHHQVVLLHVLQVAAEPGVIPCPQGAVHLVGDRIHRVERVHAHAALETAAGLLAEQALHLDLGHQVRRTLVQVREAVDLLAGQVGRRQHQVGVLGLLGQLVRHRAGVERRPDQRVVDQVFDLLAQNEHALLHGSQALDIIVSGHQCHRDPPSRMLVAGRTAQRCHALHAESTCLRARHLTPACPPPGPCPPRRAGCRSASWRCWRAPSAPLRSPGRRRIRAAVACRRWVSFEGRGVSSGASLVQVVPLAIVRR